MKMLPQVNSHFRTLTFPHSFHFYSVARFKFPLVHSHHYYETHEMEKIFNLMHVYVCIWLFFWCGNFLALFCIFICVDLCIRIKWDVKYYFLIFHILSHFLFPMGMYGILFVMPFYCCHYSYLLSFCFILIALNAMQLTNLKYMKN